MSQSGYPNLEAACGGVINPDTLLTFQKAMREYEVLMSGMRQLLAPADDYAAEEQSESEFFASHP